jgi:hypothetical protein
LATARQTNGSGYADYTNSSLRDWSADDFTVAGWFYLGDLAAGGGGFAQRLWCDNVNSTTSFLEINNDTSNGRLRHLVNNDRYYATATSTFAAGEWHHFVFTRTGATRTIYLDKTEISSRTVDTGGGGFASTMALFFAGSTDGSGVTSRESAAGTIGNDRAAYVCCDDGGQLMGIST